MKEYLPACALNETISKIAMVIIGIMIIWMIIKTINFRLLGKIKEGDNRYKAKKMINFIGYFLILMMITIVYSDKLGGLTMALGVAGAGIAFALQEVIASVAGWLANMFGGFYKIGDRVQLGGIKGDVIDIGVLRSTIMETGQWVDGDLYNGRIVRIANSFVFKEPVFNYSGDFPFLWDEIKLPIMFGSDYDLARSIILSAAKSIVGEYTSTSQKKWEYMVSKYMIEHASTEPMVTVMVNDNWVEYTLRYTVDYKKRRTTKDRLYTSILKDVEGSNGLVKFASATFHLVEAPQFKVKIEN
ncbi:MAG: mechanosensitive ion channel [Bacteroidales bacterium]|nr:mechanosensitive ion channel [Bacteroidales bacterium]